MIRIYIPRDSAARSVGADRVAAAIAAEAVKRKTEVEIVRNGSRGLFWLEPLVEVETARGRIGFGPVEVGRVASLFDAGFLNGGSHPLAVGVVDDLDYLKNQERLTFARMGLTDPLSLADYIKHDGYAGLRRALMMASADIAKEVLDSGLRGRGGAGFPAGIKWQTVLKAEADQKYVCCNADEGDSGTFADRMIMEGDPFMLIEGMTIAGISSGATMGYVYIRSEYPDSIAVMKEAIGIATEAKWLGPDIQGSGKAFFLEVRTGAGAYICGEETAMLESLEGKRGMVRPKPPIPALSGLFGKPTVINNVLTLATTPVILAKGAAFYKNFGSGRSRGTQPFQLAGNIKRTGLVEKAFGLSLSQLIYDFFDEGQGSHGSYPHSAATARTGR